MIRHWYRDGRRFVVVQTDGADLPVMIGVGKTPKHASASLAASPFLTGPEGHQAEAMALGWALGVGWIRSWDPRCDDDECERLAQGQKNGAGVAGPGDADT